MGTCVKQKSKKYLHFSASNFHPIFFGGKIDGNSCLFLQLLMRFQCWVAFSSLPSQWQWSPPPSLSITSSAAGSTRPQDVNAGTTGKRSVGCVVGGESCSSVFFSYIYIYMVYTIISYLNLPVQEIVASFSFFSCIHLFIYLHMCFFCFPWLVTICIAIPFKQLFL